MGVFDFTIWTIAFLMGLGLSHLLESCVTAFINRRRCRLHWVPLVWAACIIVEMLQYWWALYELRSMTVLTAEAFVMLLALASLLFIAGALVLPGDPEDHPANLLAYFTEDGAWAVAVLAVFHTAAVVINVYIFGVAATDPANLWNIGLAVLATLVAATRSLRIESYSTPCYVVALVTQTVLASQSAYQSAPA